MRLLARLVLLERRTSGGGGARRRAGDVLQNPGAAQHRRRAVGIGGHHQDRALAQQAEAIRIGQSHPAELVAAHVRDAVVHGPGARSGRCSWRSADPARCGPRAACCRGTAPSPRGRRRADPVSKSGNRTGSGSIVSILRTCSHWNAKLVASVRSADRPACAAPALEHRAARAAFRCSATPAVPRPDPAPQEERQPRGQLQIAQAIDRARARCPRRGLGAIQELGAGQHRTSGRFQSRPRNPRPAAPWHRSASAAPDPPPWPGRRKACDAGFAESAARRAPPGRRCRMADEDPPAAFGLAHAGDVEGTGDIEARNASASVPFPEVPPWAAAGSRTRRRSAPRRPRPAGGGRP